MTTPAAVLRLLGRSAEPGLESSLTAMRLGLQPADVVIQALPTWPLLILSRDQEAPEPLVVQSQGGMPFLAAFTSPDRTRGVDGRGLWQMWLRASVLAAGAKNGVGLVINPGSEPTLRLSSEQLTAIASLSSSSTTAPAAHPPGSRLLTPLEQTIMAFRAASRPAPSVFDAVSSADLLVLNEGDPAHRLDLASADGALATYTDEGMIPADLGSAWRVQVRGADIAALVEGRFDRIVIDPNSAFGLFVPLGDIPG